MTYIDDILKLHKTDFFLNLKEKGLIKTRRP